MNPQSYRANWRRFQLPVFALVLCSLLAGSMSFSHVHAADEWQFGDRRFRLPLTIGADGYARVDKAADVTVDFTLLLGGVGVSGPFDPMSLRVVEVDAGGAVLDSAVPFQFDRAPDFDWATHASGTLVLLMTGETLAGVHRQYDVYFDIAGVAFSSALVEQRVSFADGVMDEGFASYQFVTDKATYFYHKQGGGFSSLLDHDGNDWISWSAAGGSSGDFRGIPNLVNPQDGGYFHPGRTTSTSSVLSQGPLKVSIKSVSSDRRWETTWDIYPDYARLTVSRANGRYWFLYEGTPGGQLQNGDRIVRPNGNETAGFGDWLGDIAGEEWVYFRDATANQALFLVHEQQDTLIDSYRSMDNLMTVLGFGRNAASGRFITQVPQHFIVGFADQVDHSGVSTAVYNAYKPLTVEPAAVETTLAGPICSERAELTYFSSKTRGAVSGVSFEDEDVALYDGSTCQWSLFFDGSAAGLPAGADIDALEVTADGTIYMSFDAPVIVPGVVGKVDDSDIVRYAEGAFTLWFDGSLYGLTTNNEDIDAMSLDPSGNLIISTIGPVAVLGVPKGADEDLLQLSDGKWTLLFDGSHNGELSKEDVDGVAWLANGDLALKLVDQFVAGPVVGTGNDIVTCTPLSLGFLATSCSYRLTWDGRARGLSGVDAIAIRPIIEQ